MVSRSCTYAHAEGRPDGSVLPDAAARGEIPRHYLTERRILSSRKELDEWLIER